MSPSPVLTGSRVGQGHSFHSRLPEESVWLPAGRRAAPRHPPGAPGANVDGALAQPVLRKSHRGMVVRVSKMEGHETQKGKSQLLTAASASGKPRGCRVLRERHFLLSKIFHSLIHCWLRWVFVLGAGFLQCASGSCCPLLWLLSLWSTGSRAWASLPRGTWNPPKPGVEPTAPALARGFLAAGPLGQCSSQTPCKTRLMSAFLNSFLNMKVIFFYFKNGGKLEDAHPFAQR